MLFPTPTVHFVATLVYSFPLSYSLDVIAFVFVIVKVLEDPEALSLAFPRHALAAEAVGE